MKKLRNLRFWFRVLAGLGLSAGLVRGNTPSDPIGALQLNLLGNSDTLVSLPLLRPAVAESPVSVQAGSVLTLVTTLPTLPPEGAFILILTGSLEGAVLPITSVSAGVATVAAGSYNLASLKTETATGPGLGDLAAVVPYWTLDTVFPAGRGLNVSTDPVTHASEVLLYNDAVAGTNFTPSATYYYFAGNSTQAAGWYQTGSTVPQGTLRLVPQQYFTVRNNLAGTTQLMVCGAVQMGGYRVPLLVVQANTSQDNLVSLPVPLATTLGGPGGTGLFESGAFAASTSNLLLSDEVLLYDNTAIGHAKAPYATFYYFAGSSTKAAGWYRVGSTTTLANGFVLNPGQGMVIRKKGAGPASVAFWGAVPPYLQ
jgi:uncharacterized protein (TIGR02597 family)